VADYSFVMPFSAIAYALVPLLGFLFWANTFRRALDRNSSDFSGRSFDQPHAAPHH